MSSLTDTILVTASGLMNKYGISSVTMDDIAKECRISKRTLYEQIPDKRTLVWQCVLYNRKIQQDKAQNLVNNSQSTLDALLNIYRNARKNLTESSSVFFKDMHRLYPDMEKRCREMHREQAQSFAVFLARGVKEEMFRNDIDYELAADIFMSQTNSIMKEMAVTKEPQTIIKMMNTALVIFLRGIATQKGIKIIDDFFNENII